MLPPLSPYDSAADVVGGGDTFSPRPTYAAVQDGVLPA